MKTYDKMTGYKAIDKGMQCQGYQFELGKWHEHEGELKICESGFHFCIHPSGPWAYINSEGTRIFKVEAEDILGDADAPGADVKMVARRIRLVEEITISGHGNTGHGNTGDWNTGHGNTGHGNTGHGNTGDWNTGHRNTGDGNTGHRNTGHGNTGDRNTGDWNTGHGNTGHGNTGHGNTGHGNCSDYHTGYFCKCAAPVLLFDLPYGKPRSELPFGKIQELSCILTEDEPFDYDDECWKEIPNATPNRIRALHEAHIEARKARKARKEDGEDG